MYTIGLIFKNRDATAWILMISAMGIHVLDEALTDFIDFYNSLVQELRDGLGFFPAPIIPYGAWLGGLIAVVIAGFALTPLVDRGRGFFWILTIAMGMNMIAKASGIMLGSLLFGRLLPGFWSSPFLLAAALFVVVRGIRGKR